MKHQCRKYSFYWEGTPCIFKKIQEHEKTYVEIELWCLYAINAIINNMINAWEKLACMTVVVNVLWN